MFGVLFESKDLVSSSFEVATIATLSIAAFTFLSLTWTATLWRLTVALSGIALLASGLSYLEATEVWLTGKQMTAAHRYVGWFVVHPVQVAAIFFFALTVDKLPVGIFWRMLVASILMVLARFLGDGTYFEPTLGVLISMAFWLYILGEMYFGRISDNIAKSSRPVQRGYFWIRLIMTIGWAIYPILHFVDVIIGVGHTSSIVVLYTLADLLNLIAISAIVVGVAGKES